MRQAVLLSHDLSTGERGRHKLVAAPAINPIGDLDRREEAACALAPHHQIPMYLSEPFVRRVYFSLGRNEDSAACYRLKPR